jgi:hypothetical protein
VSQEKDTTEGEGLMMGIKRVAVTVVSGAIVVLGAAIPGAAFADDYTNPPPSVPKGPEPQVLARHFDPPKGETLPFTGADIAEMSILGGGAVLLGAAAVRRSRRSAARTA